MTVDAGRAAYVGGPKVKSRVEISIRRRPPYECFFPQIHLDLHIRFATDLAASGCG